MANSSWIAKVYNSQQPEKKQKFNSLIALILPPQFTATEKMILPSVLATYVLHLITEPGFLLGKNHRLPLRKLASQSSFCLPSEG